MVNEDVVASTLSTFGAFQATRLDYFAQLQKAVMTATSQSYIILSHFDTGNHHVFLIFALMRSQRVKENWVDHSCFSALSKLASESVCFHLWIAGEQAAEDYAATFYGCDLTEFY